jgi:hypothetical protein
MAAGFPAKTSFTDGTTLPASDLNDVTGTLNLIKPTAKGDIFVGSAANTYTKLSVGSNGQTLTATSSAATGVAWSTPSASAYTLIQTVSAVGGYSWTFSSIPQTYRSLKLVGSNFYQTSGSASLIYLSFTPNGWATGSSSAYISEYSSTGTAFTYSASNSNGTSTYPYSYGTAQRGDAYYGMSFEWNIPEYTDTDSSGTYTRVSSIKTNNAYTGNEWNGYLGWKRNGALTSFTISNANGNTTTWASGSITLYGITG